MFFKYRHQMEMLISFLYGLHLIAVNATKILVKQKLHIVPGTLPYLNLYRTRRYVARCCCYSFAKFGVVHHVKINYKEIIIYNILVPSSVESPFLFFDVTTPSGPWPPHSGGFQITHSDAPQSVGLLWTSDQLVAETST